MGNYLPNSTQTFDAKKKCLEKNYNKINKNNIEDKKNISNHKGSKPDKESSIMDTEIKENPFFFF